MSDFIEANSDEIMLRSMTNVFVEKKLDPVGKEDADIDNDGDTDKSDKYLHNRRKAIGAAIAAEKGKKKAVKEEMEESLRAKVASINEGVKLHKSEKATTSDEKAVEIVEKEVKNKVTVNPVMGESVASMIQSMYERKYMGEGLKQARKNVGASTCWDGYKAKGTKKKNGKEVPNCVKEEGLEEESSCDSDKKTNIRGYNSAEQKKRLEKKRGMKLDDHPQYKKEEVEQVNEADSLAAMAARREKRLAAQRKKMGTSSTGQDFGHDYGISSAERKKRQQAEFDKFIGRGKKTTKEESEKK